MASGYRLSLVPPVVVAAKAKDSKTRKASQQLTPINNDPNRHNIHNNEQTHQNFPSIQNLRKFFCFENNQTMEKRAPLRVHKKNPIKRNKKRLLKKVVDYLKSDCYMFAPLIYSPPSDFSAPKITCSAAIGVETEEPIRENKKIMLEEVGDYLKSDSFMYASLIGPQSSHALGTNITRSPLTGPLWYLKRVTTAISIRKVTKESNQPTEQAANVIHENRSSKGYLPETGTVSQQTQGHREMVKHMVIKNCRFSSMPGKEMLEIQPRKFAVE